MGALIGVAIQLLVLAVRLAILLVVWTVRLTMMVVGALVVAMSSKRRGGRD